MISPNAPDAAPTERRFGLFTLPGLVLLAVLAALFALFSEQSLREEAEMNGQSGTAGTNALNAIHQRSSVRSWQSRRMETMDAARTPEEIVAYKVRQFGRNRRALTHELARHFHVDVPDEVERFFAAVEKGDWEEMDAAHNAMLAPGEGLNQPLSDELHRIWRPIQEAWGAAREAHNWPAQKLLEYGNSILDSLRPGMIYIGGTDPGCFIPTMLNETSEAEKHIVFTQNALADGTYLDYLSYLYAGQMTTLTSDDSQRAFQNFLDDARKRLDHDQQFPAEPKQIKPGEDVKIIGDRIQVTGQVAVMEVNEQLLQILMDKNPNASFAMEESFPLNSTYTAATTLGPVMELRAQEDQDALTAERATQAVNYWATAALVLMLDPETPEGSDPRKAYSKLVLSQAGLFQSRDLGSQAEEMFRISCALSPKSPEAVFRYVNMLLGQGRQEDAARVAENSVKAAPEDDQFKDLLQRLKSTSSR